MNGKLLQAIGVAALLGVAALAIAALVLVPPRVNVVLGEAEAERGPDRVSALAADVAALREDLRALAGGLEQGFGAVGESLEGLAGDREARGREVSEVRADLAGLQREVAALRSELAHDRQELAGMLAALPARPAGSEMPPAAITLEPTEAAPAPKDPAQLVVEVATEVVPAEAPIAAVPTPPVEPEAAAAPASGGAKRKGFLSFKLPSDAFAFDQRTRFGVVPSLSRVGFDGKSTLHDFSGVTSRVDGELIVCLARPAEGARGRVKIESASLDTGLADRDENMRAQLDVERHREIAFEWTAFEAESVDAAAQKVRGTARGKLSLHGVTRDFAMKVEATVDASKRLSIQGQAPLDMTTFGVEPPSKLGLISMDKDVSIWIALVARPLGRVEDSEGGGAH